MNFSDQELLELAAKAAGIKIIEGSYAQGYGFLATYHVGWWNPLTDDGDAQRLSVKMGLFISNEQESSGSVTVAWGCDAGGDHLGSVEEPAPEGGDDYAAARRAIVIAAAEIRKAMQ